MGKNREKVVNSAIRDLRNGDFISVRAVSAAYGVPRTTLRDRIDGRKNRKISHQHQQRLTPEQESFLANWILELDSQTDPPTHARVREMAVRILRANGDPAPLGKDWVKSFLKRNPIVNSFRAKSMDTKRIMGTQADELKRFYETFNSIQNRYKVKTENIWNMDEHGIALEICSNASVLAGSGRKKIYKKDPQNREWVTVVETINSTGQHIRPLVIFKGKNPQSAWFEEGEIPNWLYTASENAWTSNIIGQNWLNEIFLPETKRGNEPRILIMDGHGSHVAIEFLWICKQNNVQLIFLPSHSSHVLQPLDMSVFSSMKSRYRSTVSELSYLDDAAAIKKKRFIQAYAKAREGALTERVIRNGFKAAGLVPYDPTPLDPMLTTPKNPHQVREVLKKLDESGSLDRSHKIFLQKTSGLIGKLNAQQAEQQATIHKLSSQLKTLKDQKNKKRVQVDPNTRFADIDNIRAAMKEAEEERQRIQAKQPELQAKKAGEAALKAGQEAYMFEWQAW